jgi:hypothetical protein
MDITQFIKHGIVHSSDLDRAGLDSRILSAEVSRGTLVKLRRGVYADKNEWISRGSRARHVSLMRIVQHEARNPVIFAGVSAAAAWGVPLLGQFPETVTVLDRWKGGGRSEPGVTRTSRGARTAITATHSEFTLTSIPRTVLDWARTLPLREAIATMDWARLEKNATALDLGDLQGELRLLNPRSGRRALEIALAESTCKSESFGESLARVDMWSLGFPRPTLQREFRDPQGSMFPDYAWEAWGILGEFDGKQKYSRNMAINGDPTEALWKEKKREDRLRAMGFTIVRIFWSDLEHPERLIAKLLAAGLPRVGR